MLIIWTKALMLPHLLNPLLPWFQTAMEVVDNYCVVFLMLLCRKNYVKL